MREKGLAAFDLSTYAYIVFYECKSKKPRYVKSTISKTVVSERIILLLFSVCSKLKNKGRTTYNEVWFLYFIEQLYSFFGLGHPLCSNCFCDQVINVFLCW